MSSTPHSYHLRSRVNTPASSRTPGTATTPIPKPPYKPPQSSITLELDHVIGTTTKNSSGISSCQATNTFAYCAGSVAVLAQVGNAGSVSHRYYRARPAAVALNPSSSYYATPTSTPTRKRNALITPRKDQENRTPGRNIPEDESAKTWTARERIKSIQCVSLSPNGKLLAVGEAGYNPRVLIFSTSQDASTQVPLSIISDHTWGVKSVAFSPDSRFLATLGESNDGFLFIWSINLKTGSARLIATNKCTTNICHMTWCGYQLITAGTRHVKIWQLPGYERSSPSKHSRVRNVLEPSLTTGPTPLAGRNCLLGDLADATFTCAVPISEDHLVICTDVDSLCLVHVSKTPAVLLPIQCDPCPWGAVGFREEPRRLVWAGGGVVQETSVDVLLEQDTRQVKSGLAYIEPGHRVPQRSTLRQSLGISQLSQQGSIAVACLAKHTVCIDTNSNLVLSPTETQIEFASCAPLSSHNEPVQGVQMLDLSAALGAFYTWSKNGEIRFWGSEAQLLRIEQIQLEEGSDPDDAASNELKVLRYCQRGVFLSGDRFGVLKITRGEGWQLLHAARAHSAEVTDICIDKKSTFVASCSRDRMIQVFKLQDTYLDLLQTTDDHIAAVTQATFSCDGNVLLSCSTDRTIVVREKVSRDHEGNVQVAFLQTKIITIKASPLSMCLLPGRDDILYISTLDRHVAKVDFLTGTILESFKVAEPDTEDHAVLNAIQVTTSSEPGNSRPLLIGCSSTDKSVRVYDLQKHTLLSKETAHTEGISDLALLNVSAGQTVHNRRTFVSTGYDSTIMMWTLAANTQLPLTPSIELTQEQASLNYDSDVTPAKASPAALPPLRKVLTKLDIAEFVRTAAPRSPSLRDLSPARLKRKTSKHALASSTIAEADENTSPALQRRVSADDRAKAERRSPSPPPYATRRQKKPPNRGEMTKDFFTRQSEWLRQSPEPQSTPTNVTNKQEPRTNKARLRRPPSVPTDLRNQVSAPERRPSLASRPSDLGSMNMASEQACRILRTYRKKLQVTSVDINLDEIKAELESTLDVVRQKSKNDATMVLGTRMQGIADATMLKGSASSNAVSPIEQRESTSSATGSEANSPMSGSNSNLSRQSTVRETSRDHKFTDAGADVGLGVDGLSSLLQRTNLAEV